MSDPDREAARCWRAWKTVHEMVADRGYELSEQEYDISLDDFKHQYCDSEGRPNRKSLAFKANPSPEMMEKHAPAPGQPKISSIWVDFCPEPANVGVKFLRTFAQDLNAQHASTGIFVCLVHPSPKAMQVVPTVLPSIIEVFVEADLLVNITKHELVPKHILLSREEKKRLLDRYRLKESQLPRIQIADPVARYMGLKRGQVVKIVRRSETSGRYASYRLCT